MNDKSTGATAAPEADSGNIWEKQAALLRADLKVMQSLVDGFNDDSLSRAFYNVRGAAITYLHTHDPDAETFGAIPHKNMPDVASERRAFEAWSMSGGACNLAKALNGTCEDGRTGATYYYAPTETAFRAHLNVAARITAQFTKNSNSPEFEGIRNQDVAESVVAGAARCHAGAASLSDVAVPEPFGYFHELLCPEGKGRGVWLGCPDRKATEMAYTEGETGKEVVALYRAPIAAQPAETIQGLSYEQIFQRGRMAAIEDYAQPAEGRAKVACPLPITDDEMTALKRFHECANDGEGYDVSEQMMKRLAEIGLLDRRRGTYYRTTDFAAAVLSGAFSERTTPERTAQAAIDALRTALRDLMIDCRAGITNGDAARDAQKLLDGFDEINKGSAQVIGAGDPMAFFIEFCERKGYPSDGDTDEALRGAFYEGIRYCSAPERSNTPSGESP